MDFVSDQRSCRRRYGVLNVINDYNREMIDQLILVSMSGRQVTDFLSKQLKRCRETETVVRVKNTEFTSKPMFFCSGDTGVNLGLILPGKPRQNDFVECLNGKFSKECPSANWFSSLEEARLVIAEWRVFYNNLRPHSSVNFFSATWVCSASGLKWNYIILDTVVARVNNYIMRNIMKIGRVKPTMRPSCINLWLNFL